MAILWFLLLIKFQFLILLLWGQARVFLRIVCHKCGDDFWTHQQQVGKRSKLTYVALSRILILNFGQNLLQFRNNLLLPVIHGDQILRRSNFASTVSHWWHIGTKRWVKKVVRLPERWKKYSNNDVKNETHLETYDSKSPYSHTQPPPSPILIPWLTHLRKRCYVTIVATSLPPVKKLVV